jgi:hypothetical protein
MLCRDMKGTINRLRIARIVILSKLVEGPMRSEELWLSVKTFIKSKQRFKNALDELCKEGAVKRKERTHRFVVYSISEGAERSHGVELSIARRASILAPIELVAEAMDILHSYSPKGEDKDPWVFSSLEERVQAAIDFWVERYRNLTVLNALSSLRLEVDQKSALDVWKSYRVTEDKYFDIILRLKNKYPEAFRNVLEKKLFLKGVDLKPSWIFLRLDEFLHKNYPEAYNKLNDRDKAEILFSFRRKERQKEHFYCSKYKRDYPRWFCTFCKFYKYSPTYKIIRCGFQKTDRSFLHSRKNAR